MTDPQSPQQPHQPLRVQPVAYEPLIRRVEIKLSTLVFGVFFGNILTGLAGAIAYSLIEAA